MRATVIVMILFSCLGSASAGRDRAQRRASPAAGARRASHVVRQQSNLNVPSSGNFLADITSPLPQRYPMHYERLPSGMYRVRSASGNGRPNFMDNGKVVNEEEMYKILVEAGAIKP